MKGNFLTRGASGTVGVKWRPALWMVVFGVLVSVAMLPLAGFLLVILFESISGITFQLRSVTGFVSLAIGSLIVTLGIGYVFLRTLLGPVQNLIIRTGEIDSGTENAFRPVDRAGTREMATLAERFFAIAQKLSDRSTYLTLFTSHVSHELKTPLTAIHGAAELLRDQGDSMSSEQRLRFLANIIDDASRLALLSTRLRDLAHAEMVDTSGACTLDTIVEQVAEALGLSQAISGTRKVAIAMSEENAGIVLQQLALNARQHGASTFSLHVELEGANASIRIGDDGQPISQGNRTKVFDPFFTTRRDEDGTGMGLGIARAMLESHGGTIDLCPPDASFKFVLFVPIVI